MQPFRLRVHNRLLNVDVTEHLFVYSFNVALLQLLNGNPLLNHLQKKQLLFIDALPGFSYVCLQLAQVREGLLRTRLFHIGLLELPRNNFGKPVVVGVVEVDWNVVVVVVVNYVELLLTNDAHCTEHVQSVVHSALHVLKIDLLARLSKMR